VKMCGDKLAPKMSLWSENKQKLYLF